jgi:hypothetical protein
VGARCSCCPPAAEWVEDGSALRGRRGAPALARRGWRLAVLYAEEETLGKEGRGGTTGGVSAAVLEEERRGGAIGGSVAEGSSWDGTGAEARKGDRRQVVGRWAGASIPEGGGGAEGAADGEGTGWGGGGNAGEGGVSHGVGGAGASLFALPLQRLPLTPLSPQLPRPLSPSPPPAPPVPMLPPFPPLPRLTVRVPAVWATGATGVSPPIGVPGDAFFPAEDLTADAAAAGGA